MKNYYLLSFLFVSSFAFLSAQNVGIGTDSPDASAKLDIVSTNTGLLIPRVSIGNISTFGLSGATSTAGMIVFNTNATTTGGSGIGFYYWNAGAWNYVANGNVLDASLDDGKIWIGNASNEPIENDVSGDATISNTGVLDLTVNAVETDEILNNAVDGTKIQLTGNANGDLMYYNGTDWILLAAGTSGQILRTNGAAAPTWNNPTDVLIFRNGITEFGPNIVELGGALTKNTTITQGAFQMTYNLNGLGDFNVQDNGTTRFQVLDNGRVEMSATTDANGTANSGVLEIGNSLRLDGNEIITNTDQILYLQNDNNGDLRVDGTTFAVDASANRVGIATTTPTRALDVNGTIRIRGGVPNAGDVLMAQNTNGDATWAREGYGLVPIGSIVAWHGNLSGVPGLPVGWLECNGQTVVDGTSPLNGRAIPNLNNATTSVSGDASRGRFLRGSTVSGQFQNDDANNFEQVQSQDSDEGIVDGVATIDDDGNWSSYMATSRDGGDRDPLRFRVAGIENRVTNMSVRWIMRIK